MTFKELISANEDINDRLNDCQSTDCCKKKIFRLKGTNYNPQSLQKDAFCHNKIKRGPFIIKKDFSYSPAVLTIKKNNQYHSTVGPAIQQFDRITSYYLYGIKVSKFFHNQYKRDIFKNDFFNKIRLFLLLISYNLGILLWKVNILYAIFYYLMIIFWITSIYFINLFVNFEYEYGIFLIACFLFTWQSFKIIKNMRRSFEMIYE